jgi:ABC-type spermidine/putrescine transport system permease subunit II
MIYLLVIIQLLYWTLLPSLAYPEFFSIDSLSFNFDSFNYLRLVKALGNSFFIFLCVGATNLVVMLPLAYFLAKYNSNAIQRLSILLYLPILSPILLPTLGLYESFARYDLLGTYTGVILIQCSFLYPFMLKPIESSFLNNGFLYEKVARDLGESRWNTFVKIICPLVKDAVGFGFFLTLIGSFNDYIVTFLIGDTLIETVPTLLYPLMLSDNRALSTFSVLIYTFPILLLVLFMKKKKI